MLASDEARKEADHAAESTQGRLVRNHPVDDRLCLGKHRFYDPFAKGSTTNPVRIKQSMDQLPHLVRLAASDLLTIEELFAVRQQSACRRSETRPGVFCREPCARLPGARGSIQGRVSVLRITHCSSGVFASVLCTVVRRPLAEEYGTPLTLTPNPSM